MNSRLLRPCLALGVAVPLAIAAAVLPARAQKSIEPFFQTNLKDLSAEVKVVAKNDTELRKIGKGYVDAYALTDRRFSYKEPGKVRADGKRGLITMRMVTNGDRKLMQISFPPIRRIEDLKKNPGKADSISDLGLLTPDWLPDHEYAWQRTETKDGRNCEVFRVWDKRDPAYKHTYWIDVQTKTLVEHIAHFRNRKKPGFKKRFVFSKPTLVSGVWVPTEMTVYNPEDKPAGTVRYQNLKVNTGLSDSIFKL